MRKRSQGKARREVQTQAEALIPSHDSLYQLYSNLRGSSDQRGSAKEVAKHMVLLALWFAALTTFFCTQSALLHSPMMHANMQMFVPPVTASVQRTADRAAQTSL
jgi:hypothetical protein